MLRSSWHLVWLVSDRQAFLEFQNMMIVRNRNHNLVQSRQVQEKLKVSSKIFDLNSYFKVFCNRKFNGSKPENLMLLLDLLLFGSLFV